MQIGAARLQLGFGVECSGSVLFPLFLLLRVVFAICCYMSSSILVGLGFYRVLGNSVV